MGSRGPTSTSLFPIGIRGENDESAGPRPLANCGNRFAMLALVVSALTRASLDKIYRCRGVAGMNRPCPAWAPMRSGNGVVRQDPARGPAGPAPARPNRPGPASSSMQDGGGVPDPPPPLYSLWRGRPGLKSPRLAEAVSSNAQRRTEKTGGMADGKLMARAHAGSTIGSATTAAQRKADRLCTFGPGAQRSEGAIFAAAAPSCLTASIPCLPDAPSSPR